MGPRKTANCRCYAGTTADAPTTVGKVGDAKGDGSIGSDRGGADASQVQCLPSPGGPAWRRKGRASENEPWSRRDMTTTGSARIPDSNRTEKIVPSGRAGPDQIGTTDQRQDPRRGPRWRAKRELAGRDCPENAWPEPRHGRSPDRSTRFRTARRPPERRARRTPAPAMSVPAARVTGSTPPPTLIRGASPSAHNHILELTFSGWEQRYWTRPAR
jgi:hypothetical protein